MEEAFSDVRAFHLLAGQAAPETFSVEGGTWSDRPAPGVTEDLRKVADHLRKFHDRFGESARTADHEPSRTAALRARLMLEELAEVLEALADGDLPGVADGLGDLAYVVVGSAVSYGIPLPAVWKEISRANLSKFPLHEECEGAGCDGCGGRGRRVTRDEHGKVEKPAGWTPPDVERALGLRGGAP